MAGNEQPLEESDLPPLPQEDKARTHGRVFKDELERRMKAKVPTPPPDYFGKNQTAPVKAQGVDAKLLGAVIKVFGPSFLIGGLWKVPQDFLGFVAPFLVKAVYSYVDPKTDSGAKPTWVRGITICAVLFFSQALSSLLLHQYFDRVFACSMQARGALVASIYQKSLTLSHASRSEKSLGELVNLMSVDVQRLTDLIPYLHSLLWSSPLQILISMVLLYRLVGVSSLVGLAVMLAIMPINAKILLTLRSLQEGNMKEKDKRVKTVSEILQSMKVIKMFAWEQPLTNKVSEIRSNEVSRLRRYGYLSSLQSIFWNSAPITVSIATFGAYATLGNKLDMGIVLPALSIINIMSFPLFVFPLLISAVISGKVALLRLANYMDLPERDLSLVTPTLPDDPLPIRLENVTMGWNATRPILSEVNLDIKKGGLTAIVGPVGSGKSTLLSAILGDTMILGGTVHAPRNVAYVPQQAWIQNANLRDNVLFGKEMDDGLYEETVEVCGLAKDLEKFPGGDETEIGERGVNLSGGQKQRVSIARAVYQQQEVYLLDDPISALDAHVGHHVFDQCIQTSLAGKTRILVTHKLDLLPACDHIVVLADGKVTDQGTFAELRSRGVDLGACCDEEEEDQDTASSVPAKDDAPRVFRRGSLTQIAPEADAEGADAQPKRFPSKSPSFGQVAPEQRAKGALSKDTYQFYLKELGAPALAICCVIGILSQAARNGNDWWLTRWASASDGHRVSFYLGIYAAWNLCASILFLARDVSLMLVELAAATSLHNHMLASVMSAPMKFFDQTPIGRVLNRFSNDQDSLDLTLPRTLNQLYACALRVLGTIMVICTVSPTFLFATVPISYLYWRAKDLYSKTSRELKRIESTAKSPLYSHFGETIAGASCVRASGAEQRFVEDNCDKIDRVNGIFALSNHCNRWLAVRLELCGNLIVTGAALTGVISRRLGWLTEARATLVGLSLTLALAVTNSLGWMVRMSTEAETQMNSVERVAEYVSIQSEEAWLRSHYNATEMLPAAGFGNSTALKVPNWPRGGEVVFDSYSMAYREGLPLVLQDLDVTIKPGEKVGVCGRTGAGKSSVLMGLYRMSEVRSGKIVMDGVDIADVPLEQLRGALAIVPQEPMLFQGSIAYNLDPFDEYTQQQKWEALASVQLDVFVKQLPDGMQDSVGEQGSSLSVGQRQLLCMARALLRGAKVLVLDEATAAVDHETDAMIQAAVRKACHSCTVITIAHRLNTIMDYDKVLVMGEGKKLEFDSPPALLAKKDSVFSELVRSSRIARVNSASSLAEDSQPVTQEGG
eukprot:CAMPEP_0173443524 /NCGR_PEP_ID=MMETSP1357-20121228/30032_1 /TAXON_ID=77926 /ORGANISM="Hemiselmis rufescens, Strain PCC563" /LENGTH=1295 /DNA_ID=CAMNT_0014409445 /DNA_START=9 /DNA_END=3896 /DNA_ORIENTATION=-